MPSYWDKVWEKRIKVDGVAMNIAKISRLIYELSQRDYLHKLKKLDIGCGTGIHALHLSLYGTEWEKNWTGIDLSHNAVEFAQKRGLNAVCGDIFTYDFNDNFQLFLLLDTLEHIQDHEGLAERILKISDNKLFHVFGNVPLWCGENLREIGVERPINNKIISDFMKQLRLKGYTVDIYGIHGYPFMIFEGYSNE